MDVTVARAVEIAKIRARQTRRTMYVVPTAYGPKARWTPAPFGGMCFRVSPAGDVVTMTANRDEEREEAT